MWHCMDSYFHGSFIVRGNTFPINEESHRSLTLSSKTPHSFQSAEKYKIQACPLRTILCYVRRASHWGDWGVAVLWGLKMHRCKLDSVSAMSQLIPSHRKNHASGKQSTLSSNCKLQLNSLFRNKCTHFQP